MYTPPLFVSFSDQEEFLKALLDETRHEYERDIKYLSEKNLPVAVSKRCIAVLFGYSPKFVASLIKKPDKHYRHFRLHKGRTGYRDIYAPKVGLKVIQKWLAFHLSNAIQFENNVHGFIKNKSSISAAHEHLSAKWVYNLDIKDFFPSISERKIAKSLKSIGYSKEASKLVAKLCCYKGFLAQGSPASPFLSNLVFTGIDKKIIKLAKKLNVKYTRYADDLVFSSENDFPEKLRSVKKIIEDEGFVFSERKEHLAKLPNRLKVHGLLVHNSELRLTKGYRNKIRVYKHIIETKGEQANNASILKGHISYSNLLDRFNESVRITQPS